MNQDGCFMVCTTPLNKGSVKMFDQRSSWPPMQLPNKFSCGMSNLSSHQTGGGLTASRDSEGQSETGSTEDLGYEMSPVFVDGESLSELGNVALSTGRIPRSRFKVDADAFPKVSERIARREHGYNTLPISMPSLYSPFYTFMSESAEGAATPVLVANSMPSSCSHHTGTVSGVAVMGGFSKSVQNSPRHISVKDKWPTRSTGTPEHAKGNPHLPETSHYISLCSGPVQLLTLKDCQSEVTYGPDNNSDSLVNAVGAPQGHAFVDGSRKVNVGDESKKKMAGIHSRDIFNNEDKTTTPLPDVQRSSLTEPPQTESVNQRILRQKCRDSKSFFAARREIHKASLGYVRKQFSEFFLESQVK